MPATEPYLLLGLAAIAFFLLALVISLVVRRHNLDRDNAMLDELEYGEHSAQTSGSKT